MVNIQITGQCTDSGAGRTLESLSKELKKVNLCQEDYCVGNCSLHNVQTCLRNTVINVIGEGG